MVTLPSLNLDLAEAAALFKDSSDEMTNSSGGVAGTSKTVAVEISKKAATANNLGAPTQSAASGG